MTTTHFDTTDDTRKMGKATACGRPIYLAGHQVVGGVHATQTTVKRTGKHAPTCTACKEALR